MRRLAFYGGSFDPVHDGHIAIANALFKAFDLDRFVFIPAFHAPHKPDRKPRSGYHRFAMLALATEDFDAIEVSTLELDQPERPYTVETLGRITKLFPDDRIFFVMGADSWMDITTWREWETVMIMSDHIVVTRPGVEIGFDHVTDEIRRRIVDVRGESGFRLPDQHSIFITDAVNLDVSSSEIRDRIREGGAGRWSELPPSVAKYIEKYELYT